MFHWKERERYSDENDIIRWVVQYQYEMTVIDIHTMHFNSLYSNKSFKQDIIAARVEISFWISETLFLNGTIYNTWTLVPPFLLFSQEVPKYQNLYMNWCLWFQDVHIAMEGLGQAGMHLYRAPSLQSQDHLSPDSHLPISPPVSAAGHHHLYQVITFKS